MKTLKNYFRELMAREQRPAAELVAKWTPGEIRAVRRQFRTAYHRCDFAHNQLVVEQDLSSQALGNKLANFIALHLARHLQDFTIEGCMGQGYPDRRLVWTDRCRAFAMELKGTAKFEESDNNRRILTSDPDKLLKFFTPPVKHLMVTARYQREGRRVFVRAVRLVFLEPWTKVYVRLEASVTQRLLTAERELTVCDLQTE